MHDNATLITTISKYDTSQQRRDAYCMIDIIKLAKELEDLKNPAFYNEKTESRKRVVEAFLEYATTVVKNHPDAHLDKTIANMFGESFEKMAEMAPQAYQKYKNVCRPIEPQEHTLQPKHEMTPEEKRAFVKDLVFGKRQPRNL